MSFFICQEFRGSKLYTFFLDPLLVTRSWVSATKCGPLAKICGVTKNRYGHNFQNIASKTNQRWVINYDKPLIHFGSDILKIVPVLVFLNTS